MPAKAFVGKRPCCHRAGFARNLRQKFDDDDESLVSFLLSLLWSKICLLLSFLVRLTIAVIERRRSWNRHHTDKCSEWHHFVARYINKEALVVKKISQPRPKAAAKPKLQPQGDDRYLRKQTAVEMYRRSSGQYGNRNNGQFTSDQTAAKEEFKKLPPEDQLHWEDQSALTAGIAAQNRMKRAKASASTDQPLSSQSLPMILSGATSTAERQPPSSSSQALAPADHLQQPAVNILRSVNNWLAVDQAIVSSDQSGMDCPVAGSPEPIRPLAPQIVSAYMNQCSQEKHGLL